MSAGYIWKSPRIEAAIEVFRLNVESYPESANAHDSLAEAYLKNGAMELAKQFHEKAVALDPQGPVGRHAREVLETMALLDSPPD